MKIIDDMVKEVAITLITETDFLPCAMADTKGINFAAASVEVIMDVVEAAVVVATIIGNIIITSSAVIHTVGLAVAAGVVVIHGVIRAHRTMTGDDTVQTTTVHAEHPTGYTHAY